jgi:hyperosmotically inducible periplasmic protein
MIRKMRFNWGIQCLFMIILLSGCASLFSPETIEAEPREDVILAMKIKSKLIESGEISAAAIHVKATDGTVELSGFVETEIQRELAGTIAQQTSGVKQINNQIEVK